MRWRQKAHTIIQAESAEAWRQANHNKRGRRYKRHRSYRVSSTAEALVECLGQDDEERAKAIFLRIAHGLPGVAF